MKSKIIQLPELIGTAAKDFLKEIKKEQVRLALHVLGTDHGFLDSSVTLTNRNPFDPKYTFNTFVIGSSNQFAHAACQAVSRQPGQSYNPLFIFGGAGLGKTHLLRAIGHELYQTKPNLRILFLTSEAFTNELIQAIRNEKMREFREKYRNGCDVLLLDDVHFLAGKERTQEEFFYTFNFLHESRKQIVITSDRYPKDIHGLENRLQTRFEWGLVADVQPPEIETRIAILQNKAEKEGIVLPDEVAAYIASLVTTNIRELEGSLHRVQAYAALTGVKITLELAKQILREIAPKTRHELTPEAILKIVALQFEMSKDFNPCFMGNGVSLARYPFEQTFTTQPYLFFPKNLFYEKMSFTALFVRFLWSFCPKRNIVRKSG
jgi:chromosomal replication initiator protein DnaA